MNKGDFYLKRKLPETYVRDLQSALFYFSRALHYLTDSTQGPNQKRLLGLTRVYFKLMDTETHMSYSHNISVEERARHLHEAQRYGTIALEKAREMGDKGREAQIAFQMACVKGREVELDAKMGLAVQKVLRKRDETLQAITAALDELRSLNRPNIEESELLAEHWRNRLRSLRLGK